MLAVILSFVLFQNHDYLNLIGTLIGVTGLIFVAKGNVVGQILCVVFSAYYGFVSFYTKYYGEMITYLCMSAPIALAAVISWLRHPFREKKSEVEVNTLRPREYVVLFCLTVAVTCAFYFILRALETANLIWSTVSVATSFLAASLTLRRSPFYALAYACNDVVLIVLWSLAAVQNSEYAALVVCFCVFLLEDSYGFVNWLRMRHRQHTE